MVAIRTLNEATFLNVFWKYLEYHSINMSENASNSHTQMILITISVNIYKYFCKRKNTLVQKKSRKDFYYESI